MNRLARMAVLLATLIGLGLAGWMVGVAGARQVATAMTSIGWLGMIVFTAWSGGVLLLLGAAWFAVAPGEPLRRLPSYVWARTTREAASDVLPFSQLGGLVVGVRTLAAHGVADRVIYASMIADMTTEMAAQVLFTLAGFTMLLLVLFAAPVQVGLLPIALGGVAAMIGIMAVVTLAQRPMLRLAEKIGARMLPGSVSAVAAIRDQLDAIYRRPRRVVVGFLLNLLAWVASAAGAWIALRFMAHDLPLWGVLTIEAMIFTLRSVAFAVPGALGVQEAAYVLIGPLFGLPPSAALALSLLKRARDLLIGVPAILWWQAEEYRSLTDTSLAI